MSVKRDYCLPQEVIALEASSDLLIIETWYVCNLIYHEISGLLRSQTTVIPAWTCLTFIPVNTVRVYR